MTVQLLAARWRVFYREPGALAWSLAFPFLAATGLLALAASGRDPAPLFPGFLAATLFMSAMWGLGWAVVQTRTRGLFRRLLITPVPRWKILASFGLQRLLLSVAEAILFCAFARAALGISLPLPALALAVPIGSAAFSALALAVVASSRSVESAIGRLNAVTLPLLAASGLLVAVPEPLAAATSLTPVALAADALSGSLLAPALLLVWAVLAGAFAIRRFRWD